MSSCNSRTVTLILGRFYIHDSKGANATDLIALCVHFLNFYTIPHISWGLWFKPLLNVALNTAPKTEKMFP
jgi:hypothetical protein